MATWVEEVIQALDNLGGKASLSEIYEEVERIRVEPLSNTWKATIRRTLQDYWPEASHYKDKDYFRRVATGVWMLSNQAGAPSQKVEHIRSRKKSKKIRKEIPSVNIQNAFSSIQEFREYSHPIDFSSWRKYILDVFHLLGFGTKTLDSNIFALTDINGKKEPVAVLAIIPPTKNIEETGPGVYWQKFIYDVSISSGVGWGILTDGFSFRIIDCRAKNPRKKFLSFDFDGIVINQDIKKFNKIHQELQRLKINGAIYRNKDNVRQAIQINDTPSQREYRLIWSELLLQFQKRKPGITRRSATKDSWVSIPIGISDAHLEWAIHGLNKDDGWFEVGLHFENNDKEKNLKAVNWLQNQPEFNSFTGEKIYVQPNWGKRWAKIYVRKDTSIIDDDTKSWALKMMLEFYDFVEAIDVVEQLRKF
jgi:hypothetical protein